MEYYIRRLLSYPPIRKNIFTYTQRNRLTSYLIDRVANHPYVARMSKTNDIQTVTRSGFSLKGENYLDLAFLSLRIAFKAFFSTYDVIRTFFNPKNPKFDQEVEQHIKFCEAYAETIVHFQHFFELIIKDILRRDHPLLVSTIHNRPSILYKLLHNHPIDEEEEQKLYSVKFSDALQTICELISNKQISCYKNLQFIKEHRVALEKLTNLRNRVWHRGSFFLHYTDLDIFIGKYILPIIEATINLPEYNKINSLWKYTSTECKIDPIESICLEYQKNSQPDIGKIALLKEIGRAAYANPLYNKKVPGYEIDKKITEDKKRVEELKQQGKQIPKRLKLSMGILDMHSAQPDRPYIQRAIVLSKHEAEDDFYQIKKCPVCGVESFILYEINETDQDPSTGEEIIYNSTHGAKCECCTFEIDSKLEIDKYNLPIYNYWNNWEFRYNSP